MSEEKPAPAPAAAEPDPSGTATGGIADVAAKEAGKPTLTEVAEAVGTTLTLQHNIWRGLFARGEYRHDSASQVVLGCRPNPGCSDKSQDTMSVSLYYKFF